MQTKDRAESRDGARAAEPVAAVRYRFGEYLLDCQLFELRRTGQAVELARQAFELLVYLIENRTRVVSRRELLEELWSDRVVTDNALSQAVAAVRRAIEPGDAASPSIETVYGKGFRFVAEIEALGPEPSRTASPALDPAEAERRELARAFGPMLSDLYGDLRPVRLFAVTRQSVDAAEVSIVSLYTALEINLEVGLQEPRDASAQGEARAAAAQGLGLPARLARALQQDLELELASRPLRARRRYRRRAKGVEAAAVTPRLVITGPPGSGKSTLVQHLALCLAGSILGNEEAHVGRLRERAPDAPAWMPWEQRPLLPIFVEIGPFTASEAFAAGGEGSSQQLFAYLEQRDAGRAQQSDALERYLQEREGEGALLILDGFDEAPVREVAPGQREAEDGTRERIKQVIRSFVNRFAKARVILTSRPYAYEPGSPWRLDAQGFEEVELAPLSAEQMREFCEHWYCGMAERRVIAPDQIAARAASLAAELAAQQYLVALTERPLTLTMLADLHTQDGVLPSSRAALYEESAILFLNRWNAARKSERPGENRLTVELRIGLDELRRAVEHLAYEAHRTAQGPSAAVLRAGQVIDVLFEHGAKGESERVLDFLSERSGILVADSRHRYRLPHRSYQEYLAACYLTYRDFPTQLIADVRSDPERWREVVPLAMGRMRSMPYMAIALIDQLLDEQHCDAEQLQFLAYLCAVGIEEAGLRRALQAQSSRSFARLHELLLARVRSGCGTERDRAHAAELLGQFGDPRVEQLDRVAISGGTFWMGAQRDDPAAPAYDPDAWDREGPVHEVELAPFELTRYPITVSQFARFIAQDGYEQPRLWDPAGWSWREQQVVKEPARWEQQIGHANRPVVGVSWYEADAFARWAGGRLPTEEEWEYAARGGRDWRFPWGNEEPTEQHASFGERFPAPVPVGIYPSAARNPWNLHDLAGNVVEWCQSSTRWKYEPGLEKARNAAGLQGPLPPVSRGGWFSAPRLWLRSARRDHLGAGSRDHAAAGFRVAWSVPDAGRNLP